MLTDTITSTGRSLLDTRTERAARGDHRTVVALWSDRALMHAGIAAVCSRYAPWVTLDTSDGANPVDVLLFDPTGRADDDARTLASLRERENVGAVAVLVGADTSGIEQLGPDGATIASDLSDAQLVRALLRAGSRRFHRVTGRRNDAEWFGKGSGLTRRQGQCVALCATGRSNQEIADELFVNIETVKSHLKQAYHVLGVRNRAELITLVLRLPS